MDRNWSRQELADRWSLAFEELARVEGKSESLRFGFAAQLKFYQIFGRFPVSAERFLMRQEPISATSLSGR